MTAKLTVAVIGASGITGGELCRLLLVHPGVERIHPVARTDAHFERVHRNLLGCGLRFTDIEHVKARAGGLDCVFFATPPGDAIRHAPHFLERGVRVVDLSAAFRFSHASAYERVYGHEHAAPELLEEAVFGVTEFAREQVRGARLIANPGCYVIAALLALVPVVSASRATPNELIAIHAINGTTGAGSTPRREIMHATAINDVLPYSLEGHRHAPELEEHLGRLAGTPVGVNFSTAHGNFARGIYLQAALRAPPSADWSRESLIRLYESAYGKGAEKEFFVRVVDAPRSGKPNDKEYDLYPSMARVVGSNFCHIGMDYDAQRRLIKIVAVIDNLIKGAAGSAIQNMNVMFDLDERLGLNHYGL